MPVETVSTSVADSADKRLIDLGELAEPIRRHTRAALLSAAVFAALVLLAMVLLPKKWTVTGVVGLDRTTPSVVTTKTDLPNQASVIDSATADTEVQILSSYSTVAAAVRDLKLWQDRQMIASYAGPALVGSAKPFGEAEAVQAVLGGLNVTRSGTSYALNVSFVGKDAELSARIANAVMKAYVRQQVQTSSTNRNQKIKLLSQRLDKLRNDVVAADAAVAGFRASTNLADINSDPRAAQMQMSALDQMLAEARGNAAAAQAQARGLNVVNAGAVRDLQVKVADLSAQQSDLARRYGPNHPDRVALESQLRETRAALAAEQSRVVSAAAADASAAGRRLGAVQAAVGNAQSKLLSGNRESVRLAELTRVADSARQIYQAFLDRYQIELASLGTEQSRSYIIAPAVVPNQPSFPNRPLFIGLALVGGLLFGYVVALLLEFRERGLRTRDEVEVALGLPVLSSIPDIASEAGGKSNPTQDAAAVSDFALADKQSLTAESFRAIRGALQVGKSGQTIRCVAVTSATSGEGKTSAAIGLARTTAASGLSVLLIDGDVRRRASSRNLSAGNVPAGLLEVLSGKLKLEEAMVRDSASGAYLLPISQQDDAPYDLVGSRHMTTLLERLKQNFDLVVIDTAPAINVAEARSICSIADATLFVVRWRKTPHKVAAAAAEQLRRAGATLVGAVLSQVDLNASMVSPVEKAYYQAYRTETARA